MYALTAVYSAAACPSGYVDVCDIDEVSASDFPVPALVYYYSDFAADPATVCADNGGTLL
jgi:hypothetical protein